MIILVEIILLVACFFGGILGIAFLDSRYKSAWCGYLFIGCVLGIPGYVAALMGQIGWGLSLIIHAVSFGLYLLVVLTQVFNNIEGYLVVLIITALLLTLIPTVQRAIELRHRHQVQRDSVTQACPVDRK